VAKLRKRKNLWFAVNASYNWISQFIIAQSKFRSCLRIVRHQAHCLVYRECQKKDWPNHKIHCGKEKISKKLKGTVNDPFWKYPTAPDYIYDLPINENKTILPTSLGFGTPHPSRPHSQALQRQLSLLAGDKDVDYFLFDEVQRPIRFVLPDGWTKIAFRLMRTDALSTQKQTGLRAIGEYLLKTMSNHPGLSRTLILAQLGREYGEDAVVEIKEFEKLAVKNGYKPGTTFLDRIGPQFAAMSSRK
jgi:hypothetical protein